MYIRNLVNNSINNKISFGKFHINDETKELLKAKINNPKDIDTFEKMYKKENSNDNRIIYIWKNGSLLIGNADDNIYRKQSPYQSHLDFITNLIKIADKNK